MKIAIVQIQSSSDKEANLIKIETYTREASLQRAELVVFPEMAYFTGAKNQWLPTFNDFNRIQKTFQGWSVKYGIALCPGTIRKPVPGEPEKYHNTLLFYTPEGLFYSYDKIFLYEAVLPDKTYTESSYCTPGDQIHVIDYKGLKIGFAICFDLRFPELFRRLKKKGAELVLLPSAFTVPTGQAHWEILIRARAIENQYFLVAPDLCGTSGDGAKVYGHSLVVNPWGEVIESLESQEGMKLVSIDTKQIESAAAKVASWKCRREDLFPIG